MVDRIALDRFTEDAQDIAKQAVRMASCWSHPCVDTGHILLALVVKPKVKISYILEQLGVDIREIHQQSLDLLGMKSASYNSMSFPDPDVVYTTQHVKQVLEKSSDEADNLGSDDISVEHLLLAIIGEHDHTAKILLSKNITRKRIYAILGGTSTEVTAQKEREASWDKIPGMKIEAAIHDVAYKGVRILSDVSDTHHLDILRKYLIGYETEKPKHFVGLYWVEQNIPYIAWFHYINGRKSYFHRPGKDEYFASAEWKKKRQLVIDRDHNRCITCGAKTSLQIHHRTYERFGNELLEDLVTLCQQCHSIIHKRRPFHLFCPVYPDPETT